jgi:hypothetical protein
MISKINKRFKGAGHWEYLISVPHYRDSRELFFEMREWCWNTWGPSKEISDWMEDTNSDLYTPVSFNQSWCWSHDSGTPHGVTHRLYIRGEKELVLFKLRWE